MSDFPRLIEHAFPLKQTSLDSVHEKNVRHGHISTLHIWPARRPLAACRAALIATLLPDPGTPEKRKELCEKIGGTVVKNVERKKMPNGQTVERIKEETVGGILHWGREASNAADLEWFRKEIRKAYGGRAPKVLDPFAGGGAIPLESMRLGCESTAVDINPVAWFILKCTLEYPQKLAGQKLPLPTFILGDRKFMEDFYKAQGLSGAQTRKAIETLGYKLAHNEQLSLDFKSAGASIDADLAWHVRAWGQWVLARARKDLAAFYPTYAEFEPLKKDQIAYEHRPMQLVPLQPDGKADINALNKDLSTDYIAVKANPRWIAKPTVAYLWARAVVCKNCRAQLPLLKTRWLCKKDGKRVLLMMQPNAERTGVVFGIETDVPTQGGNAAQKREHDKRISAGTMSRAGAKCPCCPTIMTMEDIRVEGQAGRLGAIPTAVVVDGMDGKEYRLPTSEEARVANAAEAKLPDTFTEIPFGMIDEPTPAGGGSGAGRAFSVQNYGMMRWRDLFAPRQLLALGEFVTHTRAASAAVRMKDAGNVDAYKPDWAEAISAYMAAMFDRLANQMSVLSRWNQGGENIEGTFARFALPMLWDFAEVNPLGDTSGGYTSAFDWVAMTCDHLALAERGAPSAQVVRRSAIIAEGDQVDCIVTDPPYYDAIPYSDLMDFFYIWLRRSMAGTSAEWDRVFKDALSPKWDREANDGELIDDESRHEGDAARSKNAYEDGMSRVFQACHRVLAPNGHLVIVFAHKHPDAWETLVAAIIRAGFLVNGSWPIQTERAARTRSLTSAALSSSVWLVCKKRPGTAKPGWDTAVLEEMRKNIRVQLREYWDAGIRGPDFVWAATGPAMEAYSKHPVVKKADQPGAVMTVTDFLNHVRRMVVDYVVGQVLSGEKDGEAEMSAADRLDEPTAYYLLHRHDFGLGEAPVGTCILYAVSCGLSDHELVQTWDLLAKTGGKPTDDDDGDAESIGDEGSEPEAEESGSKVRLKRWAQRKNKTMGYEAPNGRPVPLIDRVHRLMQLWKAGDVHKLDEYLDEHGLRRHELFKRLVQSLVELAEVGGEERALLESLSNHIGAKGTKADSNQRVLEFE